MAKFQIFKDRKGEYRWQLRTDNNEIIAESAEGYKSKFACEDRIELVKKLAKDTEVKDQT